jgi:hypothetical protein
VASLHGPYLESGTIKNGLYWDPREAVYACCVLAARLIKDPNYQVKSGENLDVPGYDNMTLDETGKILMGAGIKEMTVANYSSLPW